MSIIFGLASYKNAVAGLHLTNVQYGESASTAEATDEDGNIEQVDVYAKKRTIQAQGNVVSGGNLSALTVGGTVTMGGKAYRITSVTKTEAPNQHATFSFNGEAPMEVTSGGQVSG